LVPSWRALVNFLLAKGTASCEHNLPSARVNSSTDHRYVIEIIWGLRRCGIGSDVCLESEWDPPFVKATHLRMINVLSVVRFMIPCLSLHTNSNPWSFEDVDTFPEFQASHADQILSPGVWSGQFPRSFSWSRKKVPLPHLVWRTSSLVDWVTPSFLMEHKGKTGQESKSG